MSHPSSTDLTRRELLSGAAAGAAALMLQRHGVQAQQPPARAVVFANVSVINPDSVQDDVALVVQGDRIAAIGVTDAILKQYSNADVYDGRGKAIVPGLINCHAHLGATLQRGFNEDFGFPNSAKLAVQPGSLLQGDEATLMYTIGALEAIRTGTTTMVEFSSNIARHVPALSKTGLRWVFAEGVRDSENVPGPLSPEGFARSVPPRYSARLREEGMQRINDLFSKWHGAGNGRIAVFPAASLAETSSPELLQAVRTFAEKHDLGYTIHLSQSRAEVDFMKKHLGVSPPFYLARHDYLGPRLFAAHCRYVDDADVALLGKTRTIVSHQAAMAANRGVIPPIHKLRAAGCPIALGTDNNTNDVFEVMRIALLTERIDRDDPFPGVRPQPEDMLEDATQGGALAVRQSAQIGVVAAGRKADLLVVNTQRAHLVPAGRFLSAWIHNGQGSDIESVMIDGQFVMRDNKVLTMDEAAVIAEAGKVSRRIWSEVQKAGAVAIPGRPRRQ